MQPLFIEYSPAVAAARAEKRPIVALESTIIAHGMPYPENLRTAEEHEQSLRDQGVVPATIALADGRLKIGLSAAELHDLARSKKVEKVSRRDMARVLAQKGLGATTVSGTLMACHIAGIRFFATGGIGGVHRDASQTWDVSADLRELALAPVLCVCAGAKSILDIPKTLEVMETLGIPVFTWGSDEFPAFYSRRSGEAAPARLDTARQGAELLRYHWQLPHAGGCLLAVPIPKSDEIAFETMQLEISKALKAAEAADIRGKSLTPFLLAYLANATSGLSLKANIALVKNNVAIAATMAKEFFCS